MATFRSKEQLAQLFTLRADTRCDTAQILREATGKARAAAAAAGNAAAAAALGKRQRGRRRQQLVDDRDSEEDEGGSGQQVWTEKDPLVAAATEAAAEFKVGQAGGWRESWDAHRAQSPICTLLCFFGRGASSRNAG